MIRKTAGQLRHSTPNAIKEAGQGNEIMLFKAARIHFFCFAGVPVFVIGSSNGYFCRAT
ncbi:hypothetical protein AB1M95_09725 [Sulfitobacter sp. LCG007]